MPARNAAETPRYGAGWWAVSYTHLDVYKRQLYTLETPAGLKAVITDIGASLVSLWAPDREGKLGDVVLGYRTAAEYVANPANFGLVVGRVANRIAASRFEIAGKAYYLCLLYTSRCV